MATDSTVGVQQSATPDKLIDNEERVNSHGATVQRQQIVAHGIDGAPVVTQDDYQTGECLAEQTGAAGVLTFTFASPRNLILVQAVGTSQVARCDPFGGTPTATQGIHCDDSIPTYIPVTATVVKVFAPTGMVVSVSGFSRT